jgi:parallel beta-helix repeat protein
MADDTMPPNPIVVDANTPPCVSTTPAHHFMTITAAIGYAPAGATVVVCPGGYLEQITIGKSLTLRGVTNTAANAGAAVIAPPPGGLLVSNTFFAFFSQTAAQLLVQAANVNIVDVAVDGTGAFTGCSSPSLVGIGFDTGSSGTLKRVAVRNQNIPDGSGGYCGTGSGVVDQTAGSVTVQDSSIRGFDALGFASSPVPPLATSIVIKTTPFVSVAKANNTCVIAAAATVQLSNNTITNCGVGMLVGFNSQSSIRGNTVTNVDRGIICGLTCSGGGYFG